jgi:2-polyprenyl-3-methyl-5-hydroxy-6-metoxy-1,4-benzoquinol methylase
MTLIQHVHPLTGQPLEAQAGGLLNESSIVFPCTDGVYRIVQGENYTGNFGYQWNKFQTTQIDSVSQVNLSRERFWTQTNWKPEALDGLNILEVGSGAGRFTQVLLQDSKANVYSVDYSDAVDANYRNNGPHERLHLYRASIYEMPFAPAQFDKVFCFGVLQHTPDVAKSVQKLIGMVKPGGELVVDFYPISGWWTKLHAKYMLRPWTRKMSHQQLYNKIERNADWLIKTSQFFSRMGIGKITNRFLPICDIDGTLPGNLSKQQLREMVILDTFDMFSPEYDQPQRISTVVNWFREAGMQDVWGGFIHYNKYRAAVVKGSKPQ